MAIKDQYDTFDMRTTSGADVQYANDRPPEDATFVKRLRDAGAIILAKANLAEYAVDGARSSFGGTFCNPYDTEREPGMSSAGSGSSVAANLVTCAIGEETVVSIRWPSAVNSLVGLRIGVIREYMNRKLLARADEGSLDLVERAIGELTTLGATIVDPGPEGALFQACISLRTLGGGLGAA